MLATVEITGWHWFGFITCILLFLALDLGVFHRRAHEVSFKEALGWTAVWFSLAMAFAFFFIRPRMGPDSAVIFVTGYITELSLSMDNVFVIALIFSYFRVPFQYQHRVLFWGIVGALVMRGIMIGAGAALIQRFEWLLYVFGAFLLYTGIKMIFAKDASPEPERNPFIRLARKCFPVTGHFDGQNFTSRIEPTAVPPAVDPLPGATPGETARPGGETGDVKCQPVIGGKLALTPLALVLVMVETTDLVFAVDSIPAIFGFTTDPFLIFTSNIFAILGLRSLYFVLAGAIRYFHFLKVGLSIVLAFIGVKMLLDPHHLPPKWFQFEISSKVSLLVVAGIILISIVASIALARREDEEKRPPTDADKKA